MPNYDIAKLGFTCSFGGICIENYGKILRKKQFIYKNLITSHHFIQIWLYLAKELVRIKQKISREQIFESLIISEYFGSSRPKILKNPENQDFSVPKNPKNIKILKICLLQVFCFLFIYNLARNGQNLVNKWPKFSK